MSTITISAEDWNDIVPHIPKPWTVSLATSDAHHFSTIGKKVTRKQARSRWGLPQHKTRTVLSGARNLTTIRPEIDQRLTTKELAKHDNRQILTTIRPEIDHKLTTGAPTTRESSTPLPVPHVKPPMKCDTVRPETVTICDKRMTPREKKRYDREQRIKEIRERASEQNTALDNSPPERHTTEVGSDTESVVVLADRIARDTMPVPSLSLLPDRMSEKPTSEHANGTSEAHQEQAILPELTDTQKAKWLSLARSWSNESKAFKPQHNRELREVGQDEIVQGLHRLKCAIAPQSASKGKVTPTKALATNALSQWARLEYMDWSEYIEEAALIIRAARECPYKLFANDIRSFNGNRMTKASTLFRSDRWSPRLEEAYRWQTEGMYQETDSTEVDSMWSDFVAGVAGGGHSYSSDPARSKRIAQVAHRADPYLAQQWTSSFGRTEQDRVMERFKVAARIVASVV